MSGQQWSSGTEQNGCLGCMFVFYALLAVALVGAALALSGHMQLPGLPR